MKKNYSFKLLDGTFASSEAAQILFDMIRSKIHFHSMENFSSQERFGKDAPLSKKRLLALKKVQGSLKKFFDQAEKKELQLKIEGSVTITVVDK